MTVDDCLKYIAAYDREFASWEKRVREILRRYTDAGRKDTDTSAKFNILWSNVQTLTAATYSRIPQPDVSRRFRDQDPVGRVASLLLERSLEFEITHYGDYRTTLKQDVLDRFTGGRGIAWVRYEPHMRALGGPTDGAEVSEDVDEPGEEVDYECAPTDYVNWHDFGHTVARTWEEVTTVWRAVYMTREACITRFGKEVGSKIPLDSKPKEDRQENENEQDSRALVYEIWDKQAKKAYWLSKSLGKFVDERDDPLGLEEFFPCPRPLYATLTNETLIPVPDFVLYQDQAESLNILADRIDGLIKALQVKGTYDDSTPALARLFTEGENNTLIPVQNWTQFVERNGLQGAIDIVDLTPFANALKEAYLAFEQVKQQVYEITGISDIIRGQTEASETATAQRIKGQYASLRLKQYQEDVARFATSLLQLKAQVICGKFSPETILKIAAAEQLSEQDRALVPQAMQLLLGSRATNPDAPADANPLRTFRIEVAADTLVQLDEQAEKEARVEFLTAVGGFMKQATEVAQSIPELVPLMLDLLKFGVTGFKVGKTVEGAFDQAAEMLKASVAERKANPPPDPEMMKLQATQQLEQAKMQASAQTEQMKLQAQQQSEQQKMQFEAQMEQLRQQTDAALKQREQEITLQGDQMRMQMEEARAQSERDHTAAIERLKAEFAAAEAERQREFDRWKAELDANTKIVIQEMSNSAATAQKKMDLEKEGLTEEGGAVKPSKQLQELIEVSNQKFMEAMGDQIDGLSKNMKKLMTAPKRVVRGEDGRMTGVETVETD